MVSIDDKVLLETKASVKDLLRSRYKPKVKNFLEEEDWENYAPPLFGIDFGGFKHSNIAFYC